MGAEVEAKEERVEGKLFELSFKTFGRLTVSLPFFSLLFCFFSAVMFQYDQINDTQCNVYNFMPSISAITGITPQRYIWRVCIALHCTPRFVIGFIYYNYYMARLRHIAPSQQGWYKKLLSISFWTYIVENCCLVGVTYIANVENYPLHEKMFVLFMFTSLFHEFFALILFRWAHPELDQVPRLKLSLRLKRVCFVLGLTFTAALLYFFARHRWYCEPGAFSWFSTAEYVIAISNISFHYTASIELSSLKWLVAMPSLQGNASTNNGAGSGNNHQKKRK